MSERKFIKKAFAFLDGDKGMASQIHDILEGDIAAGDKGKRLGIQMHWSRENGSDPGVRLFTFGSQTFETFKEALAASDAARASGKEGE